VLHDGDELSRLRAVHEFLWAGNLALLQVLQRACDMTETHATQLSQYIGLSVSRSEPTNIPNCDLFQMVVEI